MTRATAYRSAAAVAAGTVLLLAYGIGALGVIGAAGDRADLLYLGVFAVAVLGALVARLRPRGMAVTLVATACVQAVVTVIALAAGLGGSNPRIEIVGLNLLFAAGFLTSARLFQHAGQQRTSRDERSA